MFDERADGAAARTTTHEYTQMVGRSFLRDAIFAVPPCSADICCTQVCASLQVRLRNMGLFYLSGDKWLF